MRRRRRSAGQALVEMCLIAPALVVLVGGAGQVGAIAYGGVTADTAAREGARIAAEYPNRSLDFVSTLGATAYTCGQTPSDSATEGSVCDAVRSASGLLPATQLTIVITANHPVSDLPPGDIVLAGNACPGEATISGIVSGLPSGTVATMASPSKATSGTVTSDSSGNYSMCLSSTKSSQPTTITATAVDSNGCTYNTSMTVTVNGKSVTPSPADMTLPTTGTCPTAVSTPTPTPTPTPAPTPTPSPGALPTPPTAPSCSTVVSDASYVSVAVSYGVPIFAPFVNRFLADTPSGSVRTVTATEVMQVEPCSITQGG